MSWGPGGQMKRRSGSIVGIVGTMALILAGCGADPTDMSSDDGGSSDDKVSNKIVGSVQEWSVQVSARKAEAGEVIFAIANYGSVEHEFLVVKTDYEPGRIPLGADNRFSEEAEGVEVVDEIPEFAVNTAGVLKVNLDAGNYQLLCNIEGHYKNGMYSAFEVVEGDGVSYSGANSGETNSGDQSADGDKVSNDITGSVKEWAVGIDANESKAGEVTFTVTNQGTIQHEFLVVRTDYKPGEIPIADGAKKFAEDDPGLEVVDEIPEWPPGETKTLKVVLEPGSYQIVCNIEDHYKAGMWAPLTVAA